MSKVVVVLNVDDKHLADNNLTLEGELGWLEKSQITVHEIIKEEEKHTFRGNEYTIKTIHDAELTHELARVTGSDCSECDEAGRKQNFTVMDFYKDDGQGVYPVIHCHNCNELIESGDGDFHDYYKIVREGESVWVEDKN